MLCDCGLQVTVTTLLAEKAKIGKTFKQDQKKVITALEEVTENPEVCQIRVPLGFRAFLF